MTVTLLPLASLALLRRPLPAADAFGGGICGVLRSSWFDNKLKPSSISTYPPSGAGAPLGAFGGFRNPFSREEGRNNAGAAPGKEEDGSPAASVADPFDLSTIEAGSDPRPFRVDPGVALDVAAASFSFLLRAGSGAFADGYRIYLTERDESRYTPLSVGKYQLTESCALANNRNRALQRIRYDPAYRPIILYEFESCPYCRKVREAASMLSLEVTYRPCPKGSVRFRRAVKEKYGQKATFPFLVDPNTDVKMFESDDIVSYLFKNYGGGRDVPSSLLPGIGTALTCGLALLPRFGRGGAARSALLPPPPREKKRPSLVLWAYESSPFCKVVREELCELQLEHVQVSCPRGSPNRQRLFERKGRFQVPYLEDEDAGVELFETAAIVEYLRRRYGVDPSPVKYL